MRITNGGEYVDAYFLAFCKHEDIIKQIFVPHTSQQNGVVEWMNITLIERTRAVLQTTRVAKSFFVQAVKIVYYLINQSPQQRSG